MKSVHLLLLVLFLIIAPTSPAVTFPKSKAASVILNPASTDPIDPQDGITDYHTFGEMVAELNQVVLDHSPIVSIASIGTTYEGRDIWAMKISDNVQIEEDEPEAYFNCMHHAREWLTVEVCLYIITVLTDNYGLNSTITDIVNSRQVWIIPMVNPDGRTYDGGDDPSSYMNWRKNRSPNWDGSRGTDLNRNYDFMWGGAGSSDQPGWANYRGSAPFSEFETQAIRDFVRQHDFVFSISYHSFGQLILYPWGNTHNATDDDALFSALGVEMSNRITNLAGSSSPGYTPVQGSDLYLTSGSDDDWLYGEMGIYSFTIEVYPDFSDNAPELNFPYNSFHPREDKIQPVCEDNIGAVLFLLEIADNPNQVMNHVTLSSDRDKATIPKDQSDSFQITILNDGKNPNAYTISHSSPSGWLVSLDNTSTALGPGVSSGAILSVLVPALAIAGTYTIWVNASSNLYPGVTDSMPIRITVPYDRDLGTVDIGYFDHLSTYPMGNYSFSSEIRNFGENAESSYNASIEILHLDTSTPQIVISEDAEVPNPSWAVIDYDGPTSSNEWHRVTSLPHNGTYSWWMGNDGTGRYSNNVYQILRSPRFSLETATSATLHFYQKLETELGYDFAAIDVGSGGEWETLESYSGLVAPSFTRTSYDISNYIGKTDVQVRFRFSSDEGVTDTGWYLDDILVIALVPQESSYYGPVIKAQATFLDASLSEHVDWRYKFVEGGRFRIKAAVSLSADENPSNDETSVIIEIDPAKYRLFLDRGWNLVSLPLVPVSNDLDVILAPIAGRFRTVRHFRANYSTDPWTESSSWKQYGDLGVVNETMGLWMEVLEDVELDIGGMVAPATAIRLSAGWNLVGYPSLTDRSFSDVLAGLPHIAVEVHDPSPPYHLRRMIPNDVFRTGSGYWIWVMEDVDWVVFP